MISIIRYGEVLLYAALGVVAVVRIRALAVQRRVKTAQANELARRDRERHP